MKIPAGTTAKQWEQYEEEVAMHEQFISNYKSFLERIVKHLKSVGPDLQWSIDEIERSVSSEISKAHSMDAPNEPGYYRANND